MNTTHPPSPQIEQMEKDILRFKDEIWGKLTEVKIKHLHDQHCQLVEYLIDIFELMERQKLGLMNDEDISNIDVVLDKVKNYVVLHLTQEEEFLSRISFPDIEKHKRSHEKFKEKFLNTRELIEKHGIQFITDLFLSVYSWLFEHINSQDMVYSDYYVQMPLASDFPSNEYLLETIMKSAVDGIVIINQKGTILKFNTASERLFEFDSAEVIGKNISSLMPSPFREHHDGYLERYFNTGEARILGSTREIVGMKKSGETFPMELSVSEFRGKESVYFTGVLHDITLRKRQQEELLQARDNLERTVQERTRQLQEKIEDNEKANAKLQLAAKVFENAGEAILITDPKGNIISVNQAYLDITGFTYDDIVGKNPRVAKSGRHDEKFYAAMWSSLKTVGKWQGEVWDRRKNGQIYPKWLTITEVRGLDDELKNYVGIFNDITDIKETEEKLEKLAYYDTLTKLPNRKLFQVRLEHEVESAKRNGHVMAVLFIDLDKFKQVNDTLGHGAGDDLLVQVSKRISDCIRKTDTVARLGGDEFTVILTNVAKEENVGRLSEEIIQSLQQPFSLSGQEALIGGSIGISMFPQDGKDIETLIKHADIAMYQAKNSGRGTFKFFMPEMNALTHHLMLMETNLKRAVAEEQFKVYYQAKVDQIEHRVVGMEALVRWEHPEYGIIPPNEFIPMAEDTGLIVPIGLQVLKIACRDTVKLHQAGFYPLKVAVNLSGRQFKQSDKLLSAITETLAMTSLSPKDLELEITESMIMGDVKEAIRVMKSIRDLDISIAMDDFGTGYSSLSYLKQFPIQTLKIDRSFIKDIPASQEDMAIVSAIISLAKNLNMGLVAEGVETKEQLAFLAERGGFIIQGYYYTPPLPFDTFHEFLKGWKWQ